MSKKKRHVRKVIYNMGKGYRFVDIADDEARLGSIVDNSGKVELYVWVHDDTKPLAEKTVGTGMAKIDVIADKLLAALHRHFGEVPSDESGRVAKPEPSPHVPDRGPCVLSDDIDVLDADPDAVDAELTDAPV